MQAERLDDLVPRVTTSGPGSDNDRALAGARSVVEGAASHAAEVGRWNPDDPLRIWKGRLRWLLHCPQRAVIDDEPARGDQHDLVAGLVVDAAAKLMALGATQPVTVDAALAFLDAQDDRRATEHLATLDDEAATSFLDQTGTRLQHLTQQWPQVDPTWWPRVEEPVRVPLAGGAVVLGGKLDVLAGGPPTDRPGLVIEVKGGRWHDSVRSEAHFYGLLLGLRDRCAPAAVVTLAAGDRTTQVEEIRPAVLVHTAERVAEALQTAASLAAGEPPEARPGSHCATCPRRATCPEALATDDQHQAA